MPEQTRIEAIFFAALDEATDTLRASYLDEACAGDEPLRRRIERLLDGYPQASEFLERPLELAEGVKEFAVSGADTVVSNSDALGSLNFLVPSQKDGSLGRIGHYEVMEVVSRGGMGIVLRAFDEKLQRIVAIKVLAPQLASNCDNRRRFVREAQVAAAVTHDNVIAIHAVEDAGPVPYLVMQFIDGPTLQQKLDRCGRLPVNEILRIGRQIAAGLVASHAQGLERVKITDFGLAHAVDDASLAESGLIAGTPAFMSPEQASGAHVDPRSDLFSLGSVLYALCTGHAPFRADTTRALLQQVRDEPPRDIRELNPDVPEALCRLIERLHAKAPIDRPTSTQEVAELLARLLADLSIGRSYESEVTSPHHGSTQQGGFTRRRVFWLAGTLVLMLIVLGLGDTTGITHVFGTVIRLFSPEGILIVEVDDPGVSVTVDGTDIIITGAGTKEIRLKPGQYKVQARRDGQVVRQELVTITRNGRQVVRLSREAKPLVTADAWEKSVAALPAEKQVEAVAQRLQELNPGFDGKIRPIIDGGAVRKLYLSTDDVADISPLRALQKLNAIECGGTRDNSGRLTDLSPLRGLSLEHLQFIHTRVADLTPLQGMPLRTLQFRHTLVSNLTPLKGMPLVHLICSYTRVSDLSPLRGIKLQSIEVEGLPITDLSPLQGMPLDWLTLYKSTAVSDLSPLRGMPLVYLNLTGVPVSDLSVLKGKNSLRHLVLDDTLVSDLTPILDLPVQRLSISGARVTDLAPLKKLPLKLLRLDFRVERDANILRSMTELETINDKPAADFWREVDGKRPEP